MCRQRRTASALRDRWQQHLQTNISRATVNRRLLSRGLHSRRPAKKPSLTAERKRQRRQWAQNHKNLQQRHWRHVLFSDESRFQLHRVDGRVRVRQEQGQRFQEDYILPTVAHGGGSVHVWGAIHYDGSRTDLVILDRNVNADSYVRVLETE